MPKLAILLATFNGERYLAHQLESLLAQTERDWTLFVRDDGSTDSTQALTRSYSLRDPRIVLIDSDGSNLGPLRSFSMLLQHAKHQFDYVMFCDQDDEWLPDKVTASLRLMQEIERTCPTTALLLHSDLVVVDSGGQMLHPSFWAYSGIDPKLNRFSRLLFHNTVTGCTALLNKPLLNLIDEIPAGAVIHDWWAALVAASFGRIVQMPQATVRYRQHEANVFGAHKWSTLSFVTAARTLAAEPAFWRRRRRAVLELPLKQARAFLLQFGERLPADARSTLDGLADFELKSWWARRAFLLQQQCLRQRASRNVALFLLA